MGDPGYSIEETMIGDRDLRSNLTIQGTMLGDTGEYLCLAQNIISSAEESAFLTVQGNYVWYKISYYRVALVPQGTK